MMAALEPWITLGRDYEASVKTFKDPVKDVYLGLFDKQIAGFLILNMTSASYLDFRSLECYPCGISMFLFVSIFPVRSKYIKIKKLFPQKIVERFKNTPKR